MTRFDHIRIGIHLSPGSPPPNTTLAALHANSGRACEILLLVDGVAEPPPATVKGYGVKVGWQSLRRRGAAFCFNQLISSAGTDLYIFLEGGAIVGPDWLNHLLHALTANPHHGLAGPLTNLAWNEQGIGFQGNENFIRIVTVARELARKNGRSWQALNTLHSLAAFCYAVKTEVVAAVGGADPAYGTGPCWEMDYNIRAARAGYLGVVARGAYVHRRTAAGTVDPDHARRLARSKRRYQDKFCGLRLAGRKSDYDDHCRGEACSHFAPPARIRIKMPRPSPGTPLTPALPPLTADQMTVDQMTTEQMTTGQMAVEQPPLVSCIMPTKGRPLLAAQAIRYFLRQDYPRRELIVVYETDDDLPNRPIADNRIHYVRHSAGSSIGSKRNLAVARAQGRIVAQWDDDDWYADTRLRRQIDPLLNHEADITGLYRTLFFDLQQWCFWSCASGLFDRMFAGNVLGGSLVYRRNLWRNPATYPETSLAEDADFLRQALHSGARLVPLNGRDLYIYLRHTDNSWSIETGAHLDPHRWQQVAEPLFLAPDGDFYRQLQQAYRGDNPQSNPSLQRASVIRESPLVSCIMPTANRPAFVATAIDHFLKQDYPHRELIIVDDGRQAVDALMPSDATGVRYLRLQAGHSLGTKRNLACQAAAGAVIAHWDDDDWMAPDWLRCQVAHLERSRAEIGGLDRVYFYDPDNCRAWQYIYPRSERPWVCGGTLCYPKSFWQQHPFTDMDVGEDCTFIWQPGSYRVVPHTHSDRYVSIIHRGNTSPKLTGDPCWHPFSPAAISALMQSGRKLSSPQFIYPDQNKDQTTDVTQSGLARRKKQLEFQSGREVKNGSMQGSYHGGCQ